MAKASDFGVSTRWTKETEIGLSGQGSSFIVSGLPTSAKAWEVYIIDAQNDSGSNQPIELQFSDDGGSTFITATNYRSRSAMVGATDTTQTGQDRITITPTSNGQTTPSSGTRGMNAHFRINNPGNSANRNTDLVGMGESGLGNIGYVFSGGYRGTTSSAIDTLKFMMGGSANFASGTMQIWSAS